MLWRILSTFLLALTLFVGSLALAPVADSVTTLAPVAQVVSPVTVAHSSQYGSTYCGYGVYYYSNNQYRDVYLDDHWDDLYTHWIHYSHQWKVWPWSDWSQWHDYWTQC